MLATDVHVITGGSGTGSLDAQFLAANGVLNFAASDVGSDTLSSGALASIAGNQNVVVDATNVVDFNLSADVNLLTAAGKSATFSTATAGGGDITFLTTANTLSTAGGGILFTAGANLTLANLNSNGGDVSLTAGTSGPGNLTAEGILTSSSGNITLNATNAAGGTVTQTGAASGLTIDATATGNVAVDSLRGTTVQLTSNTGSVSSVGANSVQASSELTLNAATGITVETQAASLEASNSTSGNISITQAASPAQTLTITGTGVVNSAASGTVSLDNLGASIAVNSSGVQSNNGTVTLAATDLQINAAVSSGTARTILANSTAGQQIDVGTNTVGKIGLTQAELNEVTAGVLQIGSPTAGAINISAAISNAATWNTLALVNNGSISEAAAGSLTLPNLRVSSAGPVTLTSANDVGTLAADTTNGFSFSNGTHFLAIGIVDGDTGIATSGSGIHLIADDMDLAQQITTGATTAGVVNLEPFTSSRTIDLGTNSANHLGLDNGELNKVTALVLRIGSSSFAGNIAVSAAISPAHIGALSLITSGNGTIT
ncbi:MAG TPA: hypothetical protein VFI31_25775, partial [Pirellulales bacterium]|nr:hypothetical protein [Pirellulales bacterium]